MRAKSVTVRAAFLKFRPSLKVDTLVPGYWHDDTGFVFSVLKFCCLLVAAPNFSDGASPKEIDSHLLLLQSLRWFLIVISKRRHAS